MQHSKILNTGHCPQPQEVAYKIPHPHQGETEKNLFVVTSLDILSGRSAASARILKISRAVALAGTRVFLSSLCYDTNYGQQSVTKVCDNIFAVGEISKGQGRGKIFNRLHTLFRVIRLVVNMHQLIENTPGRNAVYLYPSETASMDIFCLLYLKGFHHYKIFYETNEVRTFTLYNRVISRKWKRKIIDLIRYSEDFLEFKLMEKMTPFYDGLIVISTKIEKYFSKYNNKLLRIPILSDISNQHLPAPPDFLPEKGATFSLCFTGIVTLKKEGFDLLYRAMANVKATGRQIELHLYGPLHSREREELLIKLPDQLGLTGCVSYHGVIANDQLLHEMQKFHLLILPRPWSLQTDHGFSTKLSEYMVSGIPTLVTNVSDNALFIKDGVNGYIVPASDLNAMTNKLIEIMDCYQGVAQKIGENAFATARDNFHYALYSTQLAEFMT